MWPYAYLEQIDAVRNMARFYRLSVVETLFGGWAMQREWGRIGTRGRGCEHWCATREEAEQLLVRRRVERLRRGYQEPKDAATTSGPADGRHAAHGRARTAPDERTAEVHGS